LLKTQEKTKTKKGIRKRIKISHHPTAAILVHLGLFPYSFLLFCSLPSITAGSASADSISYRLKIFEGKLHLY
jgi:hypothetical protein